MNDSLDNTQAADTAGVAVSGTISLDDLDSNPDVIVSDPMTFTEMIARMAKNADMVMFIYRDDYYNKDSDMKGVAEIIIAKQRNGPIGTVQLAWLPEYTKFANLENDRKKDF